MNFSIRLFIKKLLALTIICFSFTLQQVAHAGDEKCHISTKKFDAITDELRSTLAGNLVTVWRSEWKAKLSTEESNRYLSQLLERFLSPETRNHVVKDLHFADEKFAQTVMQRMQELQKDNKFGPTDRLTLRDKPSPKGILDSTITYYTRGLVDSDEEAKHQVRLRTYLTKIELEGMQNGTSAVGYLKSGEKVKIIKQDADTYSVVSPALHHVNTDLLYDASAVKKILGDPIVLFSQSKAKCKLEIKSKLKDVISDEKYCFLGGNHLVQKLDVPLTFMQAEKLFAPLCSQTKKLRKDESWQRINHLEAELLASDPKKSKRIQAIFAILRLGVDLSPNFLMLEGATHYRRCAFAGAAGFQSTIDYDQGVYRDDIYDSHNLKDPAATIQTAQPLKPLDPSERHVELKFPVGATAQNVGVTFYRFPEEFASVLDSQFDIEFQDVADIFHQYPKDSLNRGKFHYIMKQNSED